MRKITSISFSEEFSNKIEKIKEELKLSRSELIRNIFNNLKFLYEFMGNYTQFKEEFNWDILDSETKYKLEKIKEVIKWI